MAKFMYDLNPVQAIVADAIGEPGKRTFFLQGQAGRDVVSLVMEKQDVNGLAIALIQLLEELEEKFPDLPPASKRNLNPERGIPLTLPFVFRSSVLAMMKMKIWSGSLPRRWCWMIKGKWLIQTRAMCRLPVLLPRVARCVNSANMRYRWFQPVAPIVRCAVARLIAMVISVHVPTVMQCR